MRTFIARNLAGARKCVRLIFFYDCSAFLREFKRTRSESSEVYYTMNVVVKTTHFIKQEISEEAVTLRLPQPGKEVSEVSATIKLPGDARCGSETCQASEPFDYKRPEDPRAESIWGDRRRRRKRRVISSTSGTTATKCNRQAIEDDGPQ